MKIEATVVASEVASGRISRGLVQEEGALHRERSRTCSGALLGDFRCRKPRVEQHIGVLIFVSFNLGGKTARCDSNRRRNSKLEAQLPRPGFQRPMPSGGISYDWAVTSSW